MARGLPDRVVALLHVRGGGEVSVFDVLRRCCRLLLLCLVPRFAHFVKVVDVTPRGGAVLVLVEHCPSVALVFRSRDVTLVMGCPLTTLRLS